MRHSSSWMAAMLMRGVMLMRRVMKPISERVTSEYWAQANANDCARSKNNSTRLTDVDEQDAGQQERNYIFFLNLPTNYSFILNI